MKKKRASRFLWLGFRLLMPLSLIFFIFSAHRVDVPEFLPSPPGPSYVNESFTGLPKIAFLFLVRQHLPLDFLWEYFFKNADEKKFSVYVHSRPGFIFDVATTRCTYCYGRQLNHSVQVAWGEATMIEAERLLLAAALKDEANQRFVLLSDSCVPLYNFTYIYDYLMSSPRSFVDSFFDRDSRYNPKMFPTIRKAKWRKGSQWIAVTRKHAHLIVADNMVFPMFRKHCKRRPLLNVGRGNVSKLVFQKAHNCIPDEHYVQTLLSMKDLEHEVERRTVTYTFWNASANEAGGAWHPMTFKYADADLMHVQEIKAIDHVYYETEFRTEWCRSNVTSVPCFLFARKFSEGAAARLLNEAVLGGFDPGALFTL